MSSYMYLHVIGMLLYFYLQVDVGRSEGALPKIAFGNASRFSCAVSLFFYLVLPSYTYSVRL